MKNIFYFLVFGILLASCSNHKAKDEPLPSDSIFHLQTDWQTQDNKTIKLADLKGKTLVVVMIYTSCKAACPILVGNMKKIADKIGKDDLKETSLILVTIDPKNDTPEILKEFSISNKMSDSYWTFLRGNEASTQELANVLSMKYKEISPIDFSHSNIITIFNPQGHMESQEEGLDINIEAVAKKVKEVVKKSS